MVVKEIETIREAALALSQINIRKIGKEDGFLIQQAHALIVARYQELAAEGIDASELVKTDPYERLGATVFFVALDSNFTVIGTLRLIRGVAVPNSEDVPPIDAMRWMSENVPWPHRCWPYRGKRVVLPPENLGEVGRFAIRRAVPREEKVRITRELFLAAWQEAKASSIGLVYAVMPERVARLASAANLLTTKVEGVIPRWNDPHASQLFARYPKYWNPENPPSLYFIQPLGL